MEERKRAIEAEAVGLTTDDVHRLASLYNGRLKEFGHDVRTVGWRSQADQHLRFEVLCRRLELRGKHIMDIGCGLGDFVPWAEERFGVDFDYTGIDLSEGLINTARKRFAGPRRRFELGTLTADRSIQGFDIAILSGTFTFKTADNIAVAHKVLANAWMTASEAVCANFMSSHVDSMLSKNFHFKPEDVLALALSMTRHVALYHDYNLWEFTVQLRHKPS